MKRILKQSIVILLLTLLIFSTFSSALAGNHISSTSTTPRTPHIIRLPDGIVGEPYSRGNIRPRNAPAGTTWDIWEGELPPPDWSIALHERGISEYTRGYDTYYEPPWDLPTIEESWYGTLPPGLYLDQFGGLIFGTPSQRGDYLIYASTFLPDGTQWRVPSFKIRIKEYLETPHINIGNVRDTLLTWQNVPWAMVISYM